MCESVRRVLTHRKGAISVTAAGSGCIIASVLEISGGSVGRECRAGGAFRVNFYERAAGLVGLHKEGWTVGLAKSETGGGLFLVSKSKRLWVGIRV